VGRRGLLHVSKHLVNCRCERLQTILGQDGVSAIEAEEGHRNGPVLRFARWLVEVGQQLRRQ
jgi:hypothetical protein